MMKKVLVTGAAGFLGSNLAERLLAEGYRVIGLDNFQSGQRKNIDRLSANSRFTFIEHDVIQPFSPLASIDAIFHLACPASPVSYQSTPLHTFRTSVWGTWNMLELASRKAARILFSSTSEVYGDALEHPQSERYWGNVNPIGIRSCYDEGKRGAETLCFDFHRVVKTDIRVVRIFNTYGPYMHKKDGRVVSNFICQALQGKDITIYGDGSQTRSFCYVDDLIEAFIRVMGTENFSGPINLGNPEEFTVLKLANTIIELTGSASKVVFKPLPEDDPKQRKPDISLAMEKINWQPKVQLREGLARTIDFFKTEVMETGK